MSKSKTKGTLSNNRRRKFEADTLALESLRLMAAPDPKDDLTDEELENFGKQKRYPAEMIQSLIEYVKTL
jgi:hypothetical protein